MKDSRKYDPGRSAGTPDAGYSELIGKLRFKYFLDRIFAVVLLLLTWPLFVLVAIIIKIDGLLDRDNAGSVFYTEPRMSQDKVFRIIKFRTVTSAEVNKIRQDPFEKSITGSSGVTASGKFILKWYLDELPQLVNILKGDLSFVGPRPHIVSQSMDEVERQGLTYRKYIKAGLLGIIQAWKSDPKYIDIFNRMAKRHRSASKRLNRLERSYANRCMEKNVFQICLYDAYIVARCIAVVFRGKKKY